MNLHNNYSYNGCVQIIQTLNGSTTIDKYYNNGTNILFEAYARALTGLNIRDFVPNYIELYKEGKKISHISIPVIVTYKDKDTDGGNYGVPYTRVTAVVLNSMVSTDESTGNDIMTLKLYSSASDTELASVPVTGLYGILQGITSGVQVSIMWDLYVSNGN